MRIENKLHHPFQRRDVASDTDLAIFAGDPGRAERRHLDRVLRRGEALERAFAQWVHRHDRNAAPRRLAQRGHHPGAIGAGILPDHEDRVCLVEILQHDGALPMPMLSGRPTLVASWHMLEQSGKLFVPKRRTKIW